jgi:hypothetical protein
VDDTMDPVKPADGAWRLLTAGVPLSLLMDLCSPLGPDSRGIVAREREEARGPTSRLSS